MRYSGKSVGEEVSDAAGCRPQLFNHGRKVCARQPVQCSRLQFLALLLQSAVAIRADMRYTNRYGAETQARACACKQSGTMSKANSK